MTDPIRTVLLASDLGPQSHRVLGHAAGIAHRFDAELQVVLAVEPPAQFSRAAMIETYVPAEVLAGGHARMRADLESRLEAFCRDQMPADNPARIGAIQVLEGAAHRVILDQAERLGAGLIVLGSHGHTALGEMLLGSVAHKVILESRLPLYLVPLR